MTPNAAALLEAYAPERMGRPYWFYAPETYAGGHHRGTDVRKQNADRSASIVTDVVAIVGGVVVFAAVAPGGKLGGTVVIRTGRPLGAGRYEIHSHTMPSVKVGDVVEPGERIGRNATTSDPEAWTGYRINRPGQPKTWGGNHDHVVFSDYDDGAWNTWRKTYNPEPIIAAALAAAQKEIPVLEPSDIETLVSAQLNRKINSPKPLGSGTRWKRMSVAEFLRHTLRNSRAAYESGIRIETTQKAIIANQGASFAVLQKLAASGGKLTEAQIKAAAKEGAAEALREAIKIEVVFEPGEPDSTTDD